MFKVNDDGSQRTKWALPNAEDVWDISMIILQWTLTACRNLFSAFMPLTANGLPMNEIGCRYAQFETQVAADLGSGQFRTQVRSGLRSDQNTAQLKGKVRSGQE